jgi:hypothetical protein
MLFVSIYYLTKKIIMSKNTIVAIVISLVVGGGIGLPYSFQEELWI